MAHLVFGECSLPQFLYGGPPFEISYAVAVNDGDAVPIPVLGNRPTPHRIVFVGEVFQVPENDHIHVEVYRTAREPLQFGNGIAELRERGDPIPLAIDVLGARAVGPVVEHRIRPIGLHPVQSVGRGGVLNYGVVDCSLGRLHPQAGTNIDV